MTAQPDISTAEETANGLLPGPEAAGALAAAAADVAGFKAAFGGYPAGVSVITAASATGPVGITASSVASVSAEPPILAFSLAQMSGSAAAIAEAGSLVVHLLTADDLGLARIFASPSTTRFTEPMEWMLLPTGEPLLRHAGFALRCRVLSRTPAGGSLLVAASVVEIIAPDAPGVPMVYHRRAFHGIGSHTVLPGC